MTFLVDDAYNPSVMNTRLHWISFVCGLTVGSVFVGAETKSQNAATPPPGYKTRLEILAAFGNGKLEMVERDVPLPDGVEERGLAVVHVAHDGDDGGTLREPGARDVVVADCLSLLGRRLHAKVRPPPAGAKVAHETPEAVEDRPKCCSIKFALFAPSW